MWNLEYLHINKKFGSLAVMESLYTISRQTKKWPLFIRIHYNFRLKYLLQLGYYFFLFSDSILGIFVAFPIVHVPVLAAARREWYYRRQEDGQGGWPSCKLRSVAERLPECGENCHFLAIRGLGSGSEFLG